MAEMNKNPEELAQRMSKVGYTMLALLQEADFIADAFVKRGLQAELNRMLDTDEVGTSGFTVATMENVYNALVQIKIFVEGGVAPQGDYSVALHQAAALNVTS